MSAYELCTLVQKNCLCKLILSLWGYYVFKCKVLLRDSTFLVLTLVSGIDWLFPQLSIGYWAVICLGLMLLETLWYLKPLLSPIWLALMGSSAKGFALSLGAIAYCLLWWNQTGNAIGKLSFSTAHLGTILGISSPELDSDRGFNPP